MQYVTDAQGQIHAFPDEATPEMISQALGIALAPAGQPSASAPRYVQPSVSAAPPQDTSLLRLPRMAGEALGRGFTRLLGTPGDLLASIGASRSFPMPNLTDLPSAGDQPQVQIPTTNELADIVGRSGALGDVSRTPGQGPLGEAERLGAAGLEGLGADAPYVLAGPEGLAARALISGASGVAGEAARQLFPDVPAAGPAAGLIAGGVGQAGRNLLRGNPFTYVPRELGAVSETPEQAGTALQDWARGFRDPGNPAGMDAQITQARAPLDALLPAGSVQAPTDQLVANAQDLIARGGQAANAVRDFFRRTVASGGERGAAARVVQGNLVPGGGAPVPLDWQASAGLRSELGAELRSARDPVQRQALRYLYAGHTEDLGAAAGGAGAGPEWDQFNALSTQLYALDQGPVDSLLSNQPGSAVSSLLNSGKKQGTDIAALRQAGAPVDELTGATLRYNPGVWKNLSPEAREALVPLEAHRDALNAAAATPSRLTQGMHSVTNALIGEGFGALLAHYLSGSPEAALLGNALGAGAGAVSPYVARGLVQPFRPNMLGAELMGAQAGRSGPQIPNQ